MRLNMENSTGLFSWKKVVVFRQSRTNPQMTSKMQTKKKIVEFSERR